MQEQIDKITEQFSRVNVELAQLTAVVRQNLIAQKQANDKLDRLLDDHEKRLRILESFKDQMVARLPDRLVDAGQIERDMEHQNESIESKLDAMEINQANLSDKVDSITTTIAKWGGIGAVVLFVVGLVGPPLIKWLFGA